MNDPIHPVTTGLPAGWTYVCLGDNPTWRALQEAYIVRDKAKRSLDLAQAEVDRLCTIRYGNLTATTSG